MVELTMGEPPDKTLLVMRHICEARLELRLDGEGYAICTATGGVQVSDTDIDYLLDTYAKKYMLT